MPGTATVIIGDSEWTVGVAVSTEELQAGLGGIVSIPEDTGMLLVFETEQTVAITTVPMLFDLDLIFISESFEVIDIELDIPPGLVVTEDTPVKYVLEVNAGEAEDIEVGDSVLITDYEYTPPPPEPSGMSRFMPQIVEIAMLGFVLGMVSGVMGGMSSKGNPGKGNPDHHYYWSLTNKTTGEISESATPHPTKVKACEDARKFKKSAYGKREDVVMKIHTEPPDMRHMHHSKALAEYKSTAVRQQGEWTHVKYGVEEIKARRDERGLEIMRIHPGHPVSQDDFDHAVSVAEELLKPHQSIHGPERDRLVKRFGTWAVGRAESVCPEDDVACVERESLRFYSAHKQSYEHKEVYITVTKPGDTTLNVGDVISWDAFIAENERIRRIRGKIAEGNIR